MEEQGGLTARTCGRRSDGGDGDRDPLTRIEGVSFCCSESSGEEEDR